MKPANAERDSIGLLNEYPGHAQNVRDRMLSVGIRRDHADAIRKREQDMVESGFQGRAFPQIDGMTQHRHGTVCLKFVEDPAKLGAAAIVHDHDGAISRK